MDIKRLPLEIISCILGYVDSEDLVNLFATLDRRIHLIIASPHALPVLELGKARIPRLLNRIASSSRSVGKLSLRGVPMEANALADLLLSTNPYSLDVCQTLLRSVNSLFSTEPQRARGEHTGPESHLFTPFGFPNFAVLTPRLGCLNIDVALKSIVLAEQSSPPIALGLETALMTNAVLALPPSLHTFIISKLGQHHAPYIINALPRTLTRLSVRMNNGTFPLTACFLYLTSLTDLEVHGDLSLSDGGNGDEEIDLPPSLTRLILQYISPLPLLLTYPPLQKSCVSTLQLGCIAYIPTHLEMAPYYPPTLTDLKLNIQRLMVEESCLAQLLPTTLTRLGLGLEYYHPSSLNLRSLPNLHSLDLFITSKMVRKADYVPETVATFLERSFKTPEIHVGLLPTSLTHLDLAVSFQDSLVLSEIPPLLSLSVRDMSFGAFIAFRALQPRCSLRLTYAIDLFGSCQASVAGSAEHSRELRALIRAHCEDATFDSLRLSHSLKRAYSIAGDCFTFNSGFSSRNAAETATWTEFRDIVILRQHRCRLSNSGDLIFIKSVFPNLKVLENASRDSATETTTSNLPSQLERYVYHGYLTLTDKLLPATLRHLELSGSTGPNSRVALESLPNLTYLAAPNWHFFVQNPTQWICSPMKMLRMHLSELEDVHVIRILTESVCAQTRAVMRINLSYCETGLLLDAQDRLTEIEQQLSEKSPELAERRQKTHSKLLKLLEEPMPISIPSIPAQPSKGAENIGSVVLKLEIDTKASTRVRIYGAVRTKLEF